MIEDHPVWDKLREKGLHLRPKSESRWNLLPALYQHYVRQDDRFMTETISTIGGTIWHPDDSDFDYVLEVAESELKYADPRFTRWKHFAYYWLPVPIFFAYFRWSNERENYVRDLQDSCRGANKKQVLVTIEYVVELLWSAYGYMWPKFLMRRYIWEHLGIKRR